MRLKCSTCKEMLPTSDFSKASHKKRGYAYVCKACHNVYVRETWYRKNSDKQKKASADWKIRNQASVLAKKYNASVEEIQALLDYGKCQICDETEGLHIDHCHKTGKVRGILCRGCNHGLGNFTDSVDKLQAAVLYLQT